MGLSMKTVPESRIGLFFLSFLGQTATPSCFDQLWEPVPYQ